MKIISIIGARPQFIKVAAIHEAFQEKEFYNHKIIHAGQHYDHAMSGQFFDELEIPQPEYDLGVKNSGNHAQDIALVNLSLLPVLSQEKPDAVIVYGDTNATLSGAHTASSLDIPVIHIEAGLRSFNWAMPEEVNRVFTDRLSWMKIAPTKTALNNLLREEHQGICINLGDVMNDMVLKFKNKLLSKDELLKHYKAFGIEMPRQYIFLTLHRASLYKTKDLSLLFSYLANWPFKFVWPIHPGIKSLIGRNQIKLPENIIRIDPVSYKHCLAFQKHAVAVFTDSGGIQKESAILGKKIFTLRNETEWVETVESGLNTLCGQNGERFKDERLVKNISLEPPSPLTYGDGQAAERIVDFVLLELDPS